MVHSPFPSQFCTHPVISVFQTSLVTERRDEGILERASNVERFGGRLPLLKSSENRCQIQGTCSFSVIILAVVQLTLIQHKYSTERDVRRCLGGVSDWTF